jgi:FRG domain
MADIPIYKNLEEKKDFFQNEEFYIIDTKTDLDKWFKFYSSDFKKEHPVDFIFRGVTEAKYKLFTSAQRFWITDNMEQWRVGYTYKKFIEELINKAKQSPLLKKIFSLYRYTIDERDFPILSLLQHYGAPSPVLDWTYNINCAVYFATDGVQRKLNANKSIDNYISVYSIHKKKFTKRQELISLFDITGIDYPSIKLFRDFGDELNQNSNALFILSDFEKTTLIDYRGRLSVKTTKPMTSLYNQNIIPQEGLLMYNPYKDRPIERLFNVDSYGDGHNLRLEPFKCFNIHKDLSEYLKRLIDVKYGINKGFIYPYLYDDAKNIKEAVLNSIVR